MCFFVIEFLTFISPAIKKADPPEDESALRNQIVNARKTKAFRINGIYRTSIIVSASHIRARDSHSNRSCYIEQNFLEFRAALIGHWLNREFYFMGIAKHAILQLANVTPQSEFVVFLRDFEDLRYHIARLFA